MTETIPPTYPSIDTSYFSPRSSPTPAKRLRSCLSPTRTPIGSNTPSRIHGSRAASFSSECSGMTDSRRGSKSVRWEENEECGAVTSFHPTWSAAEYDRTPLEPPSEAERTCVLPPRGSREFTSSYDCFGPHDSVDACEDEDEDAPSSPAEEISHESFVLATPDTPEDEDDEAIDETRQWEECMERRRMMFALRTRIQDQEHQPEFEGYRSLSAKLALMLESIEARREPSPDEEDEEEEEVDEQSEAAETGDSEDEGEMRPCSSFTFTNLQSLHIRSTPLDAIPDEDENSTDADLDGDAETSAPSLISSAESDQDSTLISPQPSVMSFSSPIDGLPYKSVALSLERTATVEVSAAVQ